MATLKGQNFRLLQFVPSNSKVGQTVQGDYVCFGMSTSCTVNLSANTDDASTKDDIGMASKPEVTSKSAQLQVETLNVSNTAALLAAIKSLQPFTLIWDEVSTTDNQTPVHANFSRICQAYLTDVTFQFDDRTNSTSSLQFTVTGPIEARPAIITSELVPPGSYTKGQFVRLFLGSDNTATPTAVIASAKTLSLHVSVALEDATTKDTEGDWVVQEPTSLSFDISTNALVRANDSITSLVAGKGYNDLLNIFEASSPVRFQIAHVYGANQRTKGEVVIEGSVTITALNASAPNRQNVTYDATLTGYGEYTVGDDPAES